MIKEYYNNLSKRGKILLIIAIIFLILIIIRFITKEDKIDKLDNYLTNKGFVKEEGSTMYHKQISNLSIEEYEYMIDKKEDASYEMLYFNTSNSNFMKDKMSYEDDISISFNPTYNYHDDTLTYIYRTNLYNTNIIIEGSYNGDTFICNPTFASEIDIDKVKNDICASVKYEVEDFLYEAKTLITSIDILKEMKK